MREPIRVDFIRCFPVPQYLRNQGMRCFANVVIDGRLRVDGLVVRRTLEGKNIVTWPERRDGQRRPHTIVTVIGTESRQVVEDAVLAGARKGGWIA